MIAALVLAAGMTAAPIGPAIQDAREKPREVAAIEACAKRNADRLTEIDADIASQQESLANAEARLRSWRIPSTRTLAAQREREFPLMSEVEIGRAQLQSLIAAREALRQDNRC